MRSMLALWALLAGCGARTDVDLGADAAGASLDGLDAFADRSPPTDGGGAADAPCLILASNYDTSCSEASDCVNMAGMFWVAFGDYCQEGCYEVCPGGAAINKSAASRYVAEVLRTPAGQMILAGTVACECQWAAPGEPGACCVNGQCVGWTCASVGDAGQ